MKRILLAIVATLVAGGIASAQHKGEYYLGGSLGYSTGMTSTKLFDEDELISTSKSYSGDKFHIQPEFGYFVADNLRISAILDYGYEASKIGKANGKWLRTRIHTLEIGPSISYYVRLADKFYYTPEFRFLAAVGFISNDKTSQYSYNLTAAGFDIGLSLLQVEFRPTQHFAMSVSIASLSYTYITGSDFDLGIKANTSAFSINMLRNASVGFKYYF